MKPASAMLERTIQLLPVSNMIQDPIPYHKQAIMWFTKSIMMRPITTFATMKT